MHDVLRRGLRSGALMAGAVTTTMMIASAVERGSPWAGFNAMASAGSGARARDEFDLVKTPLGIGLLSSGLVLWGIGFDGLRSLGRRNEPLVSGLLAAVGGLLFDRLVLSPDSVHSGSVERCETFLVAPRGWWIRKTSSPTGGRSGRIGNGGTLSPPGGVSI